MATWVLAMAAIAWWPGRTGAAPPPQAAATIPASAGHQEALAWLLDPTSWRDVMKSVAGTFRANVGGMVAGLVMLVVIWLASPRLVRLVREAGEAVAKPSKDSMGRTVGVLFATAGLAVRWPVTLWFAGWGCSRCRCRSFGKPPTEAAVRSTTRSWQGWPVVCADITTSTA